MNGPFNGSAQMARPDTAARPTSHRRSRYQQTSIAEWGYAVPRPTLLRRALQAVTR